jgi:hypothetical protein
MEVVVAYSPEWGNFYYLLWFGFGSIQFGHPI